MTSISEAAATSETKPRIALLASSHLAFRWLAAGGYVALALSGAISTDGRVLFASVLLIGLYLCVVTLHGLRMRPLPWLRAATPYVDAMIVTSVIVATGNVESPYAAVVLATIVLAGLNAGIIAGVEERLHDVVASAATTDALTGLPNRHGFEATYVASIGEAIGRRMPMALMLIEVDNFKLINERLAVPAGNAKLLDVAHLLESSLRRGDLVARYGGDEFVVIAPYTTRADATMLAERLRAGAGGIGASLSIGVALFPEDAAHAETLLDAADGALQRAKQAGRNCVRTAQAA